MNTSQTNQLQKKFKSALKFEIELPNGDMSQVVTIFNNSEVNFQDLVRYTHCAIAEKSNCDIKSVTTVFGTLSDGVFKDLANYSKLTF